MFTVLFKKECREMMQRITLFLLFVLGTIALLEEWPTTYTVGTSTITWSPLHYDVLTQIFLCGAIISIVLAWFEWLCIGEVAVQVIIIIAFILINCVQPLLDQEKSLQLLMYSLGTGVGFSILNLGRKGRKWQKSDLDYTPRS